MYLELDRLSKQFDGKYAVHDLSLGLEEGGLLCILGSSGCGKTTTLNMIGGFLKPDGGRVLLDRQDITALPPERRPVSTVFQSYGLFPHMSVMQNLTDAPMRVKRLSRAQATERARELLAKVGLSDKADQYPYQLSGGQQQRVAIARALCMDPEILCFDEPTSALDPELTQEVLGVMRELASERMTMLVVTHEMSFARDVADRVVFMEDGLIVEEGPPEQVFHSANPRTRQFVGEN